MAKQFELDTGELEGSWQLAPTYVLQGVQLFNWGGFSGLHQGDIDIGGTAIIGPTGSGKTTLVDALMTLLTANPKYNLASTGGHESDRDLASYVRGVSGPGDGGQGQSHIARPGKTMTGITATLSNGEDIVRLGALLWFDGASMSSSDMKKLWLFSTAPEQTLENWLAIHHEGGMRALRQLEKTDTGIWTYPSKKHYLARLRDFFEVRDNAFNLLNRAAGLKQLNSIDEIFRDLVLDDNAQFTRAKEVADSFDDLTEIHQELELARKQQRSLEPIKIDWQKFQHQRVLLDDKQTLSKILPIWFGEQAHKLWKAQVAILGKALEQALAASTNTLQKYQNQKNTRDQTHEDYLKLGGSDINTLESLIAEKQKQLARCQYFALQYQRLVSTLSLPETLTRKAVAANQEQAKKQLNAIEQAFHQAEQQAFEQGSMRHSIEANYRQLQDEKTATEKSPSSNIPRKFQAFRSRLAEALSLQESDLPFVAELVQVKSEKKTWRGAIERAIGSHRLRIMVPANAVKTALSWVNNRDNALHVRILEVKIPDKAPQFLDDGFTRKLSYKEHPYRESAKALLADLDRHCVSSPEVLKHTPFAITAEGLMSGKKRFFDKQDQRGLNDDLQTGFDNHDRLALLTQQLAEAGKALQQAKACEEKAKAKKSALNQQLSALENLASIDFDAMDVSQAELELTEQQEKLQALTAPDSDTAMAKQKLREAEQLLEALDQERTDCNRRCEKLKADMAQSEKEQSKAFAKAEQGMKNAERHLAKEAFPELGQDQRDSIDALERQNANNLHEAIAKLSKQCSELEKALVRAMANAQKEDRGALSEVGTELEDVPDYLSRLSILIEEALPEKQKRFKEYLTNSSDQGVTQLLATIEGEVERIEERLEDLNNTLRRVDFQPGRYLQLVAQKVVHESLQTFNKAKAALASAYFVGDEGESQYKALQHIVALLRDAYERQRTQGARALLDPRYRLEFKVALIDREQGKTIEIRSGSQGGSGGEKEIIASYVLTASLSYALCPDGSNRPLFGTIVLDEAFSRSSHAVAGRIIAALKEFHLHALFITPNKEMRLLRKHTRSAIVVHRRGNAASLATVSWEALEAARAGRNSS